MIFSYENTQKILSGRKTMTRRKVEPGEPCRYRVGHTYSVRPGRTAGEIARILVTHVRREPLGSIIEEEVYREGFDSREEFFEEFYRLNRLRDDGSYCSMEREVWVICFELVSDE